MEATRGTNSRAHLHALEVGHTLALTGVQVSSAAATAAAGKGCGSIACKCTWAEVMHPFNDFHLPHLWGPHDALTMNFTDMHEIFQGCGENVSPCASCAGRHDT